MRFLDMNGRSDYGEESVVANVSGRLENSWDGLGATASATLACHSDGTLGGLVTTDL